jgi:hypothetical protein
MAPESKFPHTEKHMEKIRQKLIAELNGESEQLSFTPIQFSMEVEILAQQQNCTLLEALSYMIEVYSIEHERAGKFITDGLREKLALENGIVKPGRRLPL